MEKIATEVIFQLPTATYDKDIKSIDPNHLNLFRYIGKIPESQEAGLMPVLSKHAVKNLTGVAKKTTLFINKDLTPTI